MISMWHPRMAAPHPPGLKTGRRGIRTGSPTSPFSTEHNTFLVSKLHGAANDADNWADSYVGNRQERWLRGFADLMRRAA
jgi:hypothetical protein